MTDSVQARVRSTFIHIELATSAGEASRTDARITVDSVDALGVVQARRVSAVVDVDLAIYSGESKHASAVVAVWLVGTASSIETRLGLAFVQVGLAVDAGVSGVANATIAIDLVQALGVVATRIGITFVNISLAILAGVAGLAGTGVVPGLVGTGTAVVAWSRGTIIAIGASASQTGILVVGAIVFLVLIPNTVGQLIFSTETSEIGCINVDGSRALAKEIHSSDLPSIVVTTKGFLQRSIAEFLANDFAHDIIKLIIANCSPMSLVVNFDSSFKRRISSNQPDWHASGGAWETGSRFYNDWSACGWNRLSWVRTGDNDSLGWFCGSDGRFAFLFSEDFCCGVSNIQIDDVNLGESWISWSAFEAAADDNLIVILCIFANWVGNLDKRWALVTVDKFASLPKSKANKWMEGEGQIVHLIGRKGGQFDGPGSSFIGKGTHKHSIERSKTEVFALDKSMIASSLGEKSLYVVADTMLGWCDWSHIFSCGVTLKLEQSSSMS